MNRLRSRSRRAPGALHPFVGALLLLPVLLRPGACGADVPDRSAPELTGYSAQTISECETTDGFSASTPTVGEARGRVGLQTTNAARIEGRSLHWSIHATPAGSAELTLQWRPETPPAFVALWLKNPAGEHLRATLSAVGRTGTVTLAEQMLGDERNWHQLAFPITPSAAGDINAIALGLSGLDPARSYEFYIDRIEAYRAPPLGLRAQLRCPTEETAAGTSFDTRITITPAETRPSWPYIELVLRRDGFTVAAATPLVPGSPEAGRAVDVGSISLAVPSLCLSGAYEVALVGDIAPSADTQWPTVAVAAGPPPSPSKALARAGIIAEIDGTGPVDGLKLQMLDVACAYDLYGHCADAWLDTDRFDHSYIDGRLSDLVRVSPDAMVLLRVWIYSPPWWDAAYPGDLVRFGDGKTQPRAEMPGRKHTSASWASENWRRDAARSLHALIEHVESLPVAPAVAGYLLCSGEWGNWQYPGAAYGLFADYSPAQQNAYRGWLRERYGNLAALRIAWNQPGQPLDDPEAIADGRPILTWNQIEIPTAAERAKAHFGAVRDPAGEQHLVDYDAFASDALADAIETMASVVASAAPGKLCGASYGHVFDQARYPYALQNGGHLATPTIAECDDIDFFAAPAVGMPGQSGNLPAFGVCDASLRARGKQIIYTWPSHLGRSAGGRWARDAAIQAVCAGAAFSVPAALVDDALRAVDRARPAAGPPQRADVAVILDHYSLAYTVCGNALTGPLLDEQRRAVSLMGMPADVWFLEDVLSGGIPVYRFYLVLDAFFLDDHDRAALRAQVARDGATAMYVYLAGAIDQTIGGRTMRELLGITTVRLSGSGPLQVDLGDGLTYGAREPISPRFGFGREGDPVAPLVGSGRGGLVEQRAGEGMVVWSAAPNVPARLLREYAAAAGAHVYCDGTAAVYGAGPLLGLRAAAPGPIRVRLPEAADVYDCISGQSLGTMTSTLNLNLEQGETMLLQIGSRPGSVQ